MTTNTLRFTLDGFHNRVVPGWRGRSGSFQGKMRQHAKKHGTAGVWRADESFLLLFRDHDGRIHQKSWPKAVPIRYDVIA